MSGGRKAGELRLYSVDCLGVLGFIVAETSRTRGLYLRGRTWWLCYRDEQGLYHRESSRTTNKRAASLVLAKRKLEVLECRDLGRRRVTDMTFAELTARYLDEWSKPRKAKSSHERDRQIIANLNRVFGNRPAAEINREDVERYARTRRQEREGGTVNKELSLFRAIYNWSIAQGLLQTNPASRMQMFAENRRSRFLRPDEQRRLLETCRRSRNGQLYHLVALALLTGLRRGELFALRWKHVDFEQRILLVERSKSGLPRMVPLNTEALSILRELGPKGEEERLFAVRSVKNSYRTALRRAGLTGFTFHDLRHSCASNLVNRGVNLFIVGKVLGHKTIGMTSRYSHLSNATVARAMNDLPTILPENGSSEAGETDGPARKVSHL